MTGWYSLAAENKPYFRGQFAMKIMQKDTLFFGLFLQLYSQKFQKINILKSTNKIYQNMPHRQWNQKATHV